MVSTVVDLGEDIIPILDLGEQIVIDIARLEHFGEHVKPLDVRLETPRRILHGRALIDLESPVGGLGEEEFAGHLGKKSGD